MVYQVLKSIIAHALLRLLRPQPGAGALRQRSEDRGLQGLARDGHDQPRTALLPQGRPVPEQRLVGSLDLQATLGEWLLECAR